MTQKLTVQHVKLSLPVIGDVATFLKSLATDLDACANFCNEMADLLTANPTPDSFKAALVEKQSSVTGPVLDWIKALLAQFANNPAQLLKIVQFILAMFGIVIPLPVTPAA